MTDTIPMLRQCERRTRRQVPRPLLLQANAIELPFLDGSFDAVFHFGGIQLFADPTAALREFARVVRPDGRLSVGDEGFSPALPRGDWRRRVWPRLNPGFLRPQPALAPGLVREREAWVYGGFAWLWELRNG